MMGTVSAVLRACVKDFHYLEHVPSVPMYRPGLDEPRYITREQYKALCSELPHHLELAARFAVHTLLRMREMLGLTWDRINLEQRTAWVPRRQRKGKIETFKFPLSSEVVRVLDELRTLNHSGRHVFQWQGRPVDDCNTRAFQEACRRVGLDGLRWHDLRHTGASWAAQAGVSLHEIKELGGWKDLRMVLRYAHLAPSSVAGASEKVAQFSHATPKLVSSQGEKKDEK
jgi:integrase